MFILSQPYRSQKKYLTTAVKENALMTEMSCRPLIIWNQLVTKCSFCHNLTGASKQKTYLTKVDKQGKAIQTTKYAVVWSQNVHFVPQL